MNAAIVTALGQPPTFGEFQEPIQGDGEVLIHMRAAGLHPLVKAIASGKHYSGAPTVPFVVGVDGIGTRDDGTRVYCTFSRKPFGTMAQRTVVPANMCIPIPAGIDDITAAAISNPGMSAWLSLTWKAQLAPGETVLVLGATGSAGHLAVQFAKHLGAKRVIAAGRNQAALDHLLTIGADAAIQLDQPAEALVAAFAAEAAHVNVVIDYLYGPPAEAFLKALAQLPTNPAGSRVRFVQIGSPAGDPISIPASLLRGHGLELSGSGIGSASFDRILQAIPEFFAIAASGKIHIATQPTPLDQIESAWTHIGDATRIVITL